MGRLMFFDFFYFIMIWYSVWKIFGHSQINKRMTMSKTMLYDLCSM